MSRFSYRARNSLGKEVAGYLDAQSKPLAQNSLSKKGLFPISIEKLEENITGNSNQSIKRSISFKRRTKVSTKDLASLTKQFEVMFKVGMPVNNVIATLAKQSQNPDLKKALEKIQIDVSRGERVSAAFAKHPHYFNDLYISMLEMGQSSGVLDQTLEEMGKILKKDHEIHAKVSSALLYPKIVLFTLLSVTCAMLVFVFPPFKEFYASQGAELPIPTKIVMKLSDLLIYNWHLLLLFVGAAYLGWQELKKKPKIKLLLARFSFWVPVFGRLNLMASSARFGHLVASLYRVGLPLPQTLAVVSNTLSNACIRAEILDLKAKIENGQSLSKGLEKMKYFSPMIKETCAVGEQTGKLDETLDSTAAFYDSEVDEILDNLSALIEPAMLFMLFGIVLLLALAVYMPIWGLSKAVLG